MRVDDVIFMSPISVCNLYLTYNINGVKSNFLHSYSKLAVFCSNFPHIWLLQTRIRKLLEPIGITFAIVAITRDCPLTSQLLHSRRRTNTPSLVQHLLVPLYCGCSRKFVLHFRSIIQERRIPRQVPPRRARLSPRKLVQKVAARACDRSHVHQIVTWVAIDFASTSSRSGSLPT